MCAPVGCAAVFYLQPSAALALVNLVISAFTKWALRHNVREDPVGFLDGVPETVNDMRPGGNRIP